MLTVFERETRVVVGTLDPSGDALTGDTRATRNLAAAYLANLDQPYDPTEAKEFFDGWTNGHFAAAWTP